VPPDIRLPPRINLVRAMTLGGQIHRAIFDEVMVTLVDALLSLGIVVGRSANELAAGQLNLLVGETAFLGAEAVRFICGSALPFIVFQMEALDPVIGYTAERPLYFQLMRHAQQIWDYSEINLRLLRSMNYPKVQRIDLGYTPSLQRIVHEPVRDIDMLFYGSVNDRRRRILEGIVATGAKVRVEFFCYGAQRDALIGRSKIVLNLHQFDTRHLEQVRISYLLNNGCFVISEAADENPYGDGVVYGEAEALAELCHRYLAPEMSSERMRISGIGYERLKSLSTARSIASAFA
jgi:hypothetical protein